MGFISKFEPLKIINNTINSKGAANAMSQTWQPRSERNEKEGNLEWRSELKSDTKEPMYKKKKKLWLVFIPTDKKKQKAKETHFTNYTFHFALAICMHEKLTSFVCVMCMEMGLITGARLINNERQD